jgi:NADPH2:quinone reductase
MKAIVVREFGGAEVLVLEDVPSPLPAPGQVLVRVQAAGVNPVDTYVRSGTYAIKPTLPYTPGRDLAGTVEAVGAGVTAVAPGDRVYSDGVGDTSGSYAALAVCEAAHVHRLPERISFAQGAAIGVPYGTAWRALFFRAKVTAGETVLVHGASGGVGIAAVQIARAHGLTVIGSAGTPEGLALVREQGAHVTVDHGDPDYVDAIRETTGGAGVDVVLEMLANVNLDRDLDLLAMRGRVVVIGNRGRVEIDPRKAMGRDAAILGMNIFNSPTSELASAHAGIGAGLDAATLRPIVGRELPLGEAGAAHIAVMASGALGKIVLVP